MKVLIICLKIYEREVISNMSAYKRLLKNSTIFAIANTGSKLLSIILVPFYTYVLTTEEFGTVDMLMTSISLMLPIITLSIFESTLRFSIKSDYNKKNIFTTSIAITLCGNILFLIFYPLLNKIPLLCNNIQLFYILLFLQSINSLLSQFARGINKVKLFATNGCMITFFMLILNIVFLSIFNLNIKGYLLSYIIAYLIGNLFLVFRLKVWNYLNIKSYNNILAKEMLMYSVPLIPNALMWWLMNVSDRYIITFFLGVSANGIYAVANKIPTVLNLVYSIFSQAWQLSAIEESDSKNKAEFYSNVFSIFSTVMFIGTSFIILFIKPLINVFVSSAYSDSWKYAPFLLLAAVFTSFSSFLGTNYIAMKETKGIFKTSLFGAVVNIILNIALIPLLGINGASFATMVSFFVVWIVRIYDTKSFVKLKLNLKLLLSNLLLIFVQIIFLNLNFNFLNQLALFIILLFVNRNIFLICFYYLNKGIKK